MLRRLVVLACLTLAPALASAQSITVAESTGSGTVVITSAECQNGQDQLSFQWSVASPSGSFILYASDTQGCPITAPAGTTINFKTNPISSSIQTSFTTVSVGTVLNAAQIGCTSTSTTVFVCLFDANSTATTLASVSIPLDLVAPAAPVALSASPGDSSLNVVWQLGTATADAGTPGSATQFKVYYFPTLDPGAVKSQIFTGAGTTSGRITGLTNGVEYTVQVSSLTVGGTESAKSDPIKGTPHEVEDFWRQYQQDGGQEKGGCATGAAGLTALIALTPLLLRRKRRRS